MAATTPIHKSILNRLDAMQDARADELMELKGGAIAYAQAQRDSGAVQTNYVDAVRTLVDEAVGRRKRFLKLAPWGVSGLSSVLLATFWVATAFWSSLSGGTLPGVMDFSMTLFGVLVGLLVSHFTIGVPNSWREMVRRKWKWGAIFIGYLALYILMGGVDGASSSISNCEMSLDCLLLNS